MQWTKLKSEIIPQIKIPRKTAVATFCLMTRHDCLAQHLHRTGIGCRESPTY